MRRLEKLINHRNRQSGGVTVFTAIMVLIVLTMMILYAARVGLFEQRVSANEVRQKVAFHAAESAIDQGMEYMLANAQIILSSSTDAFSDGGVDINGNPTRTRDGWFAAGSSKWTECTADLLDDMDHPCGGEAPMREGSYFYNDATTGYSVIPIVGLGADATARLTANICFVELSNPGGTCEDSPVGVIDESGTFMVITLLAYGFSDCSDVTDLTTCNGKATVAKPVGNFKNLAGSPTVPLVTKSVFPPNGTAVVVPNPNGGGEGVPISGWVNNNSGFDDPITSGTCDQDAVAVLSSGTWNTCEMQEWYGREAVPAGVACDQPPGQCSCTAEESISYKVTGQNTVLGIDIVLDEEFPCDLFHTFFNTRDTNYTDIKDTADSQFSDCSSLDENSSGLVWISGSTCNLNNVTLGSPEQPIILVSAASDTSIAGSFKLFGLMYVFDGEDAAADFTGAGTATIYGALVIDAAMDKFTGTVEVVYAEGVLAKASGVNGLGAINGGWRDFGLPAIW